MLESPVVAGPSLNFCLEICGPQHPAECETESCGQMRGMLGGEGRGVEAEGGAEQVQQGFAIAGLEEGQVARE